MKNKNIDILKFISNFFLILSLFTIVISCGADDGGSSGSNDGGSSGGNGSSAKIIDGIFKYQATIDGDNVTFKAYSNGETLIVDYYADFKNDGGEFYFLSLSAIESNKVSGFGSGGRRNNQVYDYVDSEDISITLNYNADSGLLSSEEFSIGSFSNFKFPEAKLDKDAYDYNILLPDIEGTWAQTYTNQGTGDIIVLTSLVLDSEGNILPGSKYLDGWDIKGGKIILSEKNVHKIFFNIETQDDAGKIIQYPFEGIAFIDKEDYNDPNSETKLRYYVNGEIWNKITSKTEKVIFGSTLPKQP